MVNEKNVRLQVCVSKSIMDDIDKYAAELGLSRSAFCNMVLRLGSADCFKKLYFGFDNVGDGTSQRTTQGVDR